MKTLLLIEGSVTEVKSEGYFEMKARIAQLETLARDSLKMTGDGAWHMRVRELLGEPKPPSRQLKGKIPRYQQELIDAGKLAD